MRVCGGILTALAESAVVGDHLSGCGRRIASPGDILCRGQPINVCSTTGCATGYQPQRSGYRVTCRLNLSQVIQEFSALRRELTYEPRSDLWTHNHHRTLRAVIADQAPVMRTSPAVPCSTGSSSNDLTDLTAALNLDEHRTNPTTAGWSDACAVANGVFQPPCVPVSTNPTVSQPVLWPNYRPPIGQTISRSWGSVGIMATAASFLRRECGHGRARAGHVLGLQAAFGAGPLTSAVPNSLCSEI
jgi:hypothetical protein